jgi:hypothetical protein
MEARHLLGGISQNDLLNLIRDGHIRPHPILANKIARTELRKFALEYGIDAATNIEERREMDAPTASPAWETPSFARVRAQSGRMSS